MMAARTAVAAIALAFVHTAGAACEKLSPADAAVLSKQQLSNRYCAARMGVKNSETLLKRMDDEGITQGEFGWR